MAGAEEGAIASIPGNEGRIAQAWVNGGGGLRVFSVYFWHSEGWTTRNEALLEAVIKQAITRHPWLVVCDANMGSDVIACSSLRGKITQMGVVGDFESPPHKAVCKDNTSKDPFSQCELYKEFAYRSKLSKWLQRQDFS